MQILTGFSILKSVSATIPPGAHTSLVPADVRAVVLRPDTPRYYGVVVEDLLLFSHLAILDVSNNKLRFSDFAVLPALEELRISNNCISRIDCPASGYKLLQRLDLSHNEITEKALVKLGTHFSSKLVFLNLSNNLLAVLPKEICFLQKLETLILDNNECGNTQLSLLGFLPRLRTLSLNNNLITRYLHHSGTFSNLITLYLNQNRITTIQDLADFTKLLLVETVYICENPLKLAEELVESITMPSFFDPTKRGVHFIIGYKVQKQKNKKKVNRKRHSGAEAGKLFLTQLDITETHFDQAEEGELFANDWIPSFILEELYGHVPTGKNQAPSQQMLNVLRSTVQHPPTFHLPSQKVPKRTTQVMEQESHSDHELTRSNLSSGQSSRSISNLSEAELELTKMKQRLIIAEQNFENVLNLGL